MFSVWRRKERPLAGSGSERLPSLKPKRDLTLGGAPKVYTPNIPARCNKKDAAASDVTPKATPTPTAKPKKGVRKTKQFVTSASVFSMGPADKRSAPSFGPPLSSAIKKQDSKPSKPVDDGHVRSLDLPSDDEVHSHDVGASPAIDDDDVLFRKSAMPPISLPLDKSTVKPIRHKKVKSEPLEEMEVDSSPPVAVTTSTTREITPSQLFALTEDGKGQFLLVQIPSCLPLPSGDDTDMVEHGNDKQRKEGKEVTKNRPFSGVPEGLIGKLRVHKSGKVELVLGDVLFDVAMGTRGGFLQELASIRPSEPEHSLAVLGQISQKLVYMCTPKLDTLLATNDGDR